jgi:hypothetical protein
MNIEIFSNYVLQQPSPDTYKKYLYDVSKIPASWFAISFEIEN